MADRLIDNVDELSDAEAAYRRAILGPARGVVLDEPAGELVLTYRADIVERVEWRRPVRLGRNVPAGCRSRSAPRLVRRSRGRRATATRRARAPGRPAGEDGDPEPVAGGRAA